MGAEWSRGEAGPEALFSFGSESEPKRLEEFVAGFFADVAAFEARFAAWSLDNGMVGAL